MKKLALLAAAGVLALTPFVSAQAEDHAGHAPAAEVAAEAAVVAGPVKTKLQDGTDVVIEGKTVSVVGADGATTPAPDGTHTLEDGSKVTTAGGLIVESAVEVEAPAAE